MKIKKHFLCLRGRSLDPKVYYKYFAFLVYSDRVNTTRSPIRNVGAGLQREERSILDHPFRNSIAEWRIGHASPSQSVPLVSDTALRAKCSMCNVIQLVARTVYVFGGSPFWRFSQAWDLCSPPQCAQFSAVPVQYFRVWPKPRHCVHCTREDWSHTGRLCSPT
ncbi:hypothetical protein EVAR_99715_1 [Eumeta japonica]|uniref:Uncharacterized protein n=1 Tax=Eumeta variegata TaxID=151549 RepID=A0A4C1ZLG3_EUMVA|nr:hypothetical protein EVAR_99715_1 [Eumeta japonica]